MPFILLMHIIDMAFFYFILKFHFYFKRKYTMYPQLTLYENNIKTNAWCLVAVYR